MMKFTIQSHQQVGSWNFEEMVSSEIHNGTRDFFIKNRHPLHCWADVRMPSTETAP